MKLVREHIEQFTRGENTFKTLNIGKRAQIENWFKTWAPDAKYEIDDNLNIKVKGFLSLIFANTTYLPNNLHIENFLYIEKTEITSLPDNLHVEENLYMENTKITSLPDNLTVDGRIYKDFK